MKYRVRVGDDGATKFESNSYDEAEAFAAAQSERGIGQAYLSRSDGQNLAFYRAGECEAFLENGTNRWVRRRYS